MEKLLKRLIDITVSGLLLWTIWPLIALVALLVHLKLGSPVIFRQTRIGLHDEPFSMMKFRTMTNASDAQGNLLPDALRLTAFGKFLRSTSLDELPELWNIFVGNMSLVGPRPLLPEYMPYYTPTELKRHTMRPGVTGLAQVCGRNALGWNERLALDVEYVERFSLKLDAQILWRTVMVVLKREGISAQGHVTMRRLDDERKDPA
ncbi:MAG: sugar transferase [Azospirillum brasilense]|nr:MAG: sugar transferase [Azospirillum brasilense]